MKVSISVNESRLQHFWEVCTFFISKTGRLPLHQPVREFIHNSLHQFLGSIRIIFGFFEEKTIDESINECEEKVLTFVFGFFKSISWCATCSMKSVIKFQKSFVLNLFVWMIDCLF
jgi:K+ transporter